MSGLENTAFDGEDVGNESSNIDAGTTTKSNGHSNGNIELPEIIIYLDEDRTAGNNKKSTNENGGIDNPAMRPNNSFLHVNGGGNR